MGAENKYPASSFVQALHVLNSNSKIDVFENNLYVDLDKVRGDQFIKRINAHLGIVDESVPEVPEGFAKILFFGHKGSGKSVELERLKAHVDTLYFTVFIDIEKELVRLSAVEPEDIYQLVFIKLIEELSKKEIPFSPERLTSIINIWYEEQSIQSQEATKFTTEVGMEAEVGIAAWVVKLRGYLKSLITAESTEIKTVRQNIKNNIRKTILELNVILAELSYAIRQQGYNGFLFIFDGTEKLRYELSQTILLYDPYVFEEINANFIFACPVVGLYDILHGQNSFISEMLPMIKLTPESIEVLKKIITCRINEELFFEDGVLDCVIKKSGGSIRQMMEIVYQALLSSDRKKISFDILKTALYDLGLGLYRRLTGEHKSILTSQSTDYNFGEQKVQELLFGLVLLVQNGSATVNPLVKPFIDKTENYLCD